MNHKDREYSFFATTINFSNITIKQNELDLADEDIKRQTEDIEKILYETSERLFGGERCWKL